ncbi:MAG TPA: hypothetical protein VF158_12205 [Longimicrobiales bacterium]
MSVERTVAALEDAAVSRAGAPVHPAAAEVAQVRARVGGVVAEVVRQAVRDAGATGVVLLDDGSPEAGLAREWCTQALGADAVVCIPPPAPAAVEACRRVLGADVPGDAAAEEAHRFHARLAAAGGALVAHPANKTALLLGPRTPPEPLLPLGDLYAGQVATLAGAWTAPPEVRRLAELAGGVAALDAALHAWLEERRPIDAALAPLGPAAAEVRRALEAGRFHRRRVGLVPKLGSRTLGIDLFG